MSASQIISIVRRIKEGFYSEKNISLLAEVHNTQNRIIFENGYSLLENTNNKETIIVYHLLSAIRQFYQSNSPLTGLIS